MFAWLFRGLPVSRRTKLWLSGLLEIKWGVSYKLHASQVGSRGIGEPGAIRHHGTSRCHCSPVRAFARTEPRQPLAFAAAGSALSRTPPAGLRRGAASADRPLPLSDGHSRVRRVASQLDGSLLFSAESQASVRPGPVYAAIAYQKVLFASESGRR